VASKKIAFFEEQALQITKAKRLKHENSTFIPIDHLFL
jgi:hypothetical protein